MTFDEKHRLVGIEVLAASKNLPPDVLGQAEEGGPDPSHWYEA